MIGRTIRPRPLSYTERIPVIFLHRPKDPEDSDSQPLDPALEQFLKNCEDEREQNGLLSGLETSRRRRKNRHHRGAAQQQLLHTKAHSNSAGKVVDSAAGGGAARKNSKPVDPHGRQQEAHRQPPGGGANGATARDIAIAVPTCREISDYASNEQAMDRADSRKAAEAAGPSLPLLVGIMPDVSPCLTTQGSLGLDAAAYIIYQDLLRDRRAEPALLQYDMDDEDEAALLAINASIKSQGTKSGSAAASRTPPTTRGAAAAAAAVAASMLDEDGFEVLIGALERAHFEALQQKKELWQAEVKAGRVPKIPVTEKILPWEAAVAAVQQHQPPLPALPRGLYNHWLKRRKQESGPLLEYLWYEQPWKAICFQDRTPGHEGEQGDMPFMATETKNSTRAWNRIRIDKKEAYELLEELREEFELLRTLADQVRKRERLKKQLLKLYRAEMAAKLGLNLHSRHAAAAAATGTAAAGKKCAASLTGGTATAAGAQAAATAAAAGPGLPPRKRRRVSVDEAVKPKAPQVGAPAADAAVEPVDAARAKGAAKQRQPARGPSAEGGARGAKVARVTVNAGRRPSAPPAPASCASHSSISMSSPSASSGASADSSSGTSSARSDSDSDSGSDSMSTSRSRSDSEAVGAGTANTTGRGRRPPAAARARGASRRQWGRVARNPRSQAQGSAAAAEGDASGSSEGDSSDEWVSGAGVEESDESASSSGSDSEPDVVELSSSRSGSLSGDRDEDGGSDAAGSDAAGSPSTSSATGAELPSDEDEKEGARKVRKASRQRGRSRSRSRARSTGRGRGRSAGGCDADGSSSEEEQEEAGTDVDEADEERGQDGRERSRRGRTRQPGVTAGKSGSSARARSMQRGSPSQRRQKQHPSTRLGGQVRSRSATRASAAAAKPLSASPAWSPSSSETRSSSPTRSGRDLRESSSSPEPSRSPSRSPPPRRARRASAPLAGGRAVTQLPSPSRQRRLTVGGASARQAARKGVRFTGPAPGMRGRDGGGEHKATRPNRELEALLRMQPRRGMNQGADGSLEGDNSKAGAKRRISQPRPRKATASRGESTARKARSSTGGDAAAEPEVAVAPAKSPLTGSKRPLEQRAAGSPATSPSHKKSNLGWRKELASLIGRPLAATARFLLQRKQLRGAGATATNLMKGRKSSDGHGVVGPARRNSMLRERNGTVS